MTGGFVVVTTDDLQPATLHLWKYWEDLKAKHPGLRMTAFVSVNNQEFGQLNNDVRSSPAFRDWFEQNRGWVEVAMHGFDHTKPPEFQRLRNSQREIILKSWDAMRPFLEEDCVGFKAPYYRMSWDTVELLARYKVSYYSQWWNTHLLVPARRQMPRVVEVGTHTSLPQGKNPDNIDRVFEDVDRRIAALELDGWQCANLRDIVRGVTG